MRLFFVYTIQNKIIRSLYIRKMTYTVTYARLTFHTSPQTQVLSTRHPCLVVGKTLSGLSGQFMGNLSALLSSVLGPECEGTAGYKNNCCLIHV